MTRTVAAADLQPGYQIPEFSVTVTPKMVIMGATCSRDWQPIHHDVEWAKNRAGLPNIILNNYTQAGWLNRYITDWSGPEGRLGRMKFSMLNPICPDDTAIFRGTVTGIGESGDLLWVDIDLIIAVGSITATKGGARLALPSSPEAPSPWRCAEDAWSP